MNWFTTFKKRFRKDKIIIIGQSWGSVLGSQYALKHPENVVAYIGVGQVIDFDKGKIFCRRNGHSIGNRRGQGYLKKSC